jgi:hypothetical protein
MLLSRIRATGLAVLLAAIFSMAGATDLRAQITPESAEGQNIQAVIDFLKSIGKFDKSLRDFADELAAKLKDGKLYQDDIEKKFTGQKGDLAETNPATKNITIDNRLVGKIDAKSIVFDPKTQFSQIFVLAATLRHESVHAGQPVDTDRKAQEYEAWTKTLTDVNDWVRKLWVDYKKAVRTGNKDDRILAAQKFEAAATIFASEASAFVEEHKAFGHDTTEWKKYASIAGDIKGSATTLKFAEMTGKSDPEKVKALGSLLLGDLIKQERTALGIKEPERPPRPLFRLPKPHTGIGHPFPKRSVDAPGRSTIGSIPSRFHFGLFLGSSTITDLPTASSSGFYSGNLAGNSTAFAFGGSAFYDLATIGNRPGPFGSFILSAGVVVDHFTNAQIRWRGTCADVACDGSGRLSELNYIGELKLTTPLPGNNSINGYVGFGGTTFYPEGSPTGGTAFRGNASTAAFRVGFGVDHRFDDNWAAGFKVGTQFSGSTDYDTTLVGERFRLDRKSEVIVGLTLTYTPTRSD